jgi:hypothetical protein
MIGRSIFLVKHDLFRKPVSTFPDHALAPSAVMVAGSTLRVAPE